MDLISIIIPVYNTSKYLEECILSIINQSYKNFEAIFVNDGSTDNSLTILNKYASIDNRIIVINQKNNGVSNARNKALKNINGKYLAFIDSDDIVSKNYLMNLFNLINQYKCQLSICNFCFLTLDSLKKNNPYKLDGLLNKDLLAKEILDQKSVKGYLWNKLFVTKIIKDNNIAFNTRISMCEDLLFCIQYINYISTGFISNDYLYSYRQRKSSAISNFRVKDLTAFDAIVQINSIDNSFYKYSYDLYVYLYFKYYKVIRNMKNFNHCSLIKIIFDKNVKKTTKILAIINIIIPNFILDFFRQKKMNKLKYFK